MLNHSSFMEMRRLRVLSSCIVLFFLSPYYIPQNESWYGDNIARSSEVNFIFVLSHQAVLKYSGCGDKWLSQARNVMLRDLDHALTQINSFYQQVQRRIVSGPYMSEGVRRSLFCFKFCLLAHRLMEERKVKVWVKAAATLCAQCDSVKQFRPRSAKNVHGNKIEIDALRVNSTPMSPFSASKSGETALPYL